MVRAAVQRFVRSTGDARLEMRDGRDSRLSTYKINGRLDGYHLDNVRQARAT